MSTPTLTPSPARTQSLVRRHPLISFFVLTYVAAWLLWAPLVIFRDQHPRPAGIRPSRAGIQRAVRSGRVVNRPPSRQSRRTHTVRTPAPRPDRTVLVPRALALAVPAPRAVGVSTLLGGPNPVVVATIPAIIVSFLFSIFPGSAVGEELGWRGFALPRLQARHSALSASLIVGVPWGIYHFPLWLPETGLPSLFLPFASGARSSDVLHLDVQRHGRQPAHRRALHAITNLPLTVVYEQLGERLVPVFWLLDAILAITAAVLIARTGAATLSRVREKQTETP